MGESENTTQGATLGLVPSPRRKSIIIQEVENGFIVQEQFYTHRRFIADTATRACQLAQDILTSAAA